MKWLALAVVCCLALAGCSGKKDKDAEPSATSSASSSSPAPVPAAGLIEVMLNRTSPNGAAPLALNFTINATFTKANGTAVATPGLASWNVTYTLLGDATGNTTGDATGNVTQGPVGTSFPANVTLDLAIVGNYSLRVVVKAPAYQDGNASFLAAVLGGGSTGSAPVFFEGGELDTSQWTLQSRIYFNANIASQVPSSEVPQSHPDGGWVIRATDAHSGEKSWTTPYPDNYRARMTSVPFTVPAGGMLSYWVKGGAEANNVDGIHVLTGPATALAVVAYHTGVIAEWTEFTVDLSASAGKEIVVQFRLDSDVSCSNDGPPSSAGAACGAGYNGGGLSLDDITVA